MVSGAGTLTKRLPLLKLTTAPPAGALPFKVTVPVKPFPPISVAADRPRLVRLAAFTVTETVAEHSPMEAVIAAATFVAVGLADTVKFAEVCPAGTITLAPTWTSALLLWRFTLNPPSAASPVKITVPVRVFPPVTALAERLTDETQTA